MVPIGWKPSARWSARLAAPALGSVVWDSPGARRPRRLSTAGFSPAGEVEPGQALVIVGHLQTLLAQGRGDVVARLQPHRREVDEPPVDELELPLGPGVAL